MTTERGRRWETKPSIFVLSYALKNEKPPAWENAEGVAAALGVSEVHGTKIVKVA